MNVFNEDEVCLREFICFPQCGSAGLGTRTGLTRASVRWDPRAAPSPHRQGPRNEAVRLSAYFISKTAMILIPAIVWPTFFVTVVTWTTGFSMSFATWLAALFIIYFEVFVLQSVGLVLATMRGEDVMVAAILYLTFAFSQCGLFLPIEDQPVWISAWAPYLNPLWYLLQLFTTLAFQINYREFECDPQLRGPGSPYPSCGFNGTGIITPPEVLPLYGVVLGPGVSCLALAIIAVVSRVAAFYLLRRRVRKARRSKRGVRVEEPADVAKNGPGTSSQKHKHSVDVAVEEVAAV